MKPDRIIVYLPCHSLHDFPTWLDELESDALLAAWTAAWHPWLIATVGSMPHWASVDLPQSDRPHLGIVPAPWDDRFAAQYDAHANTGSRWVRHVTGNEHLIAAAAAAVADGQPVPAMLPGASMAEAFHTLGLASLLAELLAQRMRSSAVLTDDGFAESVVKAARAAICGEDDDARAILRECYGFLESTRAHYYPVDVWLVDVVLLADSTLGESLDRELESPAPMALVAAGSTIEKLAGDNPAALKRVRERCENGTLAPAGGRYDSRTLDACSPEAIVQSFERGLNAWKECVGTSPVTYAQQTGGSSAILPQVLSSLGFTGMIWTLFDGTALPDPGGSRIRWEGTGGGCIDGIGRVPLDARCAQSILSLPDRLGDAMDHDHTAIVQFAHHVGTANPWFDALRRIGGASTVLGTFVTPPELFRRTTGAGTLVSFEPDVFPISLPDSPGTTSSRMCHDPVAAGVAAAKAEATRLSAARAALDDICRPSNVTTVNDAPKMGAGNRINRGLSRFFATGGRSADELVLEHDRLRIQVHRQTGGLLSLRRPSDRENRLSQRLAMRTTRPAPPAGHAWEDVSERAVYSEMRADSVERLPAGAGRGEAIESRGRLISSQQREAASFTQRIELLPGLPLALIEIEVRGIEPSAKPLLEHHVACRFAWNENTDIDIRRSLHTQSIATERGRFTAPWFIELCDADHQDDPVVILTGGLPWHVRASPHMLDSILPGGRSDIAGRASTDPPAHAAGGFRHRLAVGIGVERPWDMSLPLLTDAPLEAFLAAAGLSTAANVRLTIDGIRKEGDRVVAARVGVLESAGRAGGVRLAWASDVVRAVSCDALGRPLSDFGEADAGVSIDGRSISLFLKRYEWRHLDLEFRR